MITIDDVLLLHKLSIDKYGGSPGLRDENLLQSAVARPHQTFDGKELYSSIYDKAAALMESLIINHPFVDGNKRIGFLAMFAFLRLAGYKMVSSEDEAYSLTIGLSKGEINYKEIAQWLRLNTKYIL